MLNVRVQADLGRQPKASALDHSGYVQIEEITVEHGLNDAGNYGDQIVVVLGEVSVDPVQQVERTIRAQCEQIV